MLKLTESHDFNNLLCVIRASAGFLQQEAHLDAQGREDLQEIRAATERAVALVAQLLAFGRQQVLESRAVDLNEAVTNIVPMLRRLVPEDIHLVSQLDEGVGHTLCDPGQLEQVVMNLTVNARDAMPAGGVITLQTRRVELTEHDRTWAPDVRPGAYAVVEVADTGSGIPPELLERIFEPFFTTKEVGKGTGLGLATVHGIVLQSGGQLSVQSEVGAGTTFRIYLPSTQAPEEERGDAATPPRGESQLRGATVLVVEDEDSVRRIVTRVLEHAGCRVLLARHGKDALLVAKDHPGRIDLVVSDVVMPEMNGRELAARLAALKPPPPVVWMSGYTDEEMIRRGLSDGCVRLLHKPFGASELLAVVEEALALRAARAA